MKKFVKDYRRAVASYGAQHQDAICGDHADAAETGAITRSLTYVAAERRRLYRPTFWRSFLQIDRSIPVWADTIESHKLNDFAGQPKPVQMLGAQGPKAEAQRVLKAYKQFEYTQSYDVMDREILRYQATGMNIGQARLNAVNTACEQFLEGMAATGDPYGLSLLGLANQANVTIVTAGVTAGFTGAWATATFAGMLADLQFIAKQVYLNSKQNFQSDTLVLPLLPYYYISEKTNSTTDKSVKELFLETTDSIKRIVPWNQLATAGASSATRAIAFDSRFPEVARMILTKELTEDAPRRIALGTTVDLSMITGGVICEAESGLLYADGL